jgi:hypothetical protein
MTEIFDLFGDPVPANHGKRGRPQHVVTQENRRKVSMLVAFGWNNERIASALRITPPSLRRHYFSELKFREVARDRLDTALAMKLWEQAETGNVGAIKEFRKLIEHNDLMSSHFAARFADKQPKEPKLGKKEKALLAASQPDTETSIGELMAQRQSKPDNTVN